MTGRARALALLALAAAGIVALVPAAGRLLVVSDPVPPHADAIVLLAGSPAARALATADLYARGTAPRVVLTRERVTPATAALERRGVRVPRPDEETRAILGALGVPDAAITVLPGRAYSTDSEARLIARWACRSRVRSLVVVTSPSHTRRARSILRRVLAPTIAVAVRPAPADYFPRRWWRRRAAAKLVLSEYQKLAHYWLRERWRLRACGA
jgi:uncharacterized SAM-binding protein YcdF (DUF218 family)